MNGVQPFIMKYKLIIQNSAFMKSFSTYLFSSYLIQF